MVSIAQPPLTGADSSTTGAVSVYDVAPRRTAPMLRAPSESPAITRSGHGDVSADTVGRRARRAALWTMAHGMRTFPLVPDGKPPAVRDWEHRASSDPRSIDDWPRRTTGYGIACGPSGLLVVDCDTRKPDTPPPPAAAADADNGIEALLLLAADLGQPMPRDTFSVRTGRAGLHLYYRAPDGASLGNSAGRLAWLVDSRGRGGYVVGPGSVVDGRSYEVIDWSAPAVLPAWIADALGTGKTASQEGAALRSAPTPVRLAGSSVGPEWIAAALAGEAERIRTAPSGAGNAAVNASGFSTGRLVGAHLVSRDDAERKLVAAIDTWHFEPTHDARGRVRESAGQARTRMLRTLARALDAGERSPRVVTPATERRRAA